MNAHITSKPRYQLIHGRRLILKFSDGTRWVIWLDQGFGYWAMSKQQLQTPLAAFPMNQPPDVLGEKLAEIKISIEGHDLPTQIFIDFSKG